MVTRKGSDNRFPLVRLLAGTDEDEAPTGELHLRADSATKLPYLIDDDGLRTDWPAGGSSVFVGARAWNNTTQSVPTGTVTPLTLNSEHWDTDGFHSTSSDTSRFTVPTGKAGYYLLQGGSSAQGVGISSSEVLFRKNGSTFVPSAAQGKGNNFWLTTSGIEYLADGDYVEMCLYHEAGSNQTVGGTAGVDNFTWVSVALLGT